MTQQEQSRLRHAITLLCTDDGFDAGMAILSELAGCCQARRKILDAVVSVSPVVVAKRPNDTVFRVKLPRKE